MTRILLVSALLLTGCQPGVGVRNTGKPMHAPELVGVWYTVKKGETVKSLARRCNISARDVRELNGLDDKTKLQPGKPIFLYGIDRLICKAARRGRRNKTVLPGKTTWVWPTRIGRISSAFDARRGKRRKHRGIDIAAKTGTKIYAAMRGTVVFSGTQGAYGRVVIIEHPNDYVTVYAHNSMNKAERGDEVGQSTWIANVGNTGRSTGPHLHFEIRKKGVPTDPLKLLPRGANRR